MFLCMDNFPAFYHWVINRVAVAQKVRHSEIIKISYWFALKPAKEIRFIRQMKASIEHYNIISWY